MLEPKCWPIRVNSQSHDWCQSKTISRLDSKWLFNVVLNLCELEICLILVGKLFQKMIIDK